MDVVKGAIGCAVAALLAGHQLSTMDAGRQLALRSAVRTALGMSPPAAAAPAPRTGPSPQAVAAPVFSASLGEEVVTSDRFGQFRATVEIGGERLPVLVDTGATFVALRAEDAERLGIRPMPADYRTLVDTANGRASFAQVRLASVRLGAIEVRDVAAMVSGPGQLGQTLLGMSFLSRLSGVRIDRGRLLLSR